MKLKWKVNDITGEKELARINHIILDINEKIERALGFIDIEPSEGMFFNGYQTWTLSREYVRNDRMRGLNGMPEGVIKRYSLEGYSDYHFTRYPFRPGIFHGYSYCYFRDGDRYKFFGSLDERPGYTIFGYNVKKSRLKIIRDAEGLIPQRSFHAIDLFYMEGTENEVFDGWFDALGIKPIPAPKIAGYSSWYNRYEYIDHASITEDLKGCKEILKKGDLFQVDDGWETKVGDWNESDPEKFPEGMKALADMIHDAGFMAGLWMAPFAAARGSRVLQEHPDWVIRDEEGRPFSCGCNWGGFYGLDIDIPECLKYIEDSVKRAVYDWGFDFLKLDFLYAAAAFGNEKETRAGKMIRAMELIRSWVGGKKILACGVPLMPAFGLADYSRIGCDVGLTWRDRPFLRLTHRERVSTVNSILDTIYRRQLDGRAFGNDPDVFFLRTENLELTEREKDILATVNALLGSVFLTSDDPLKYTDEQKEKYAYYRHLTEAENVRLIKRERMGISYRLDGREQEYVIPEEIVKE
ncbi:MAG: alpha-galactosidase [Firmicutes bacterium]|nr:alpha-galactosidase [Bacillota bacterium]